MTQTNADRLPTRRLALQLLYALDSVPRSPDGESDYNAISPERRVEPTLALVRSHFVDEEGLVEHEDDLESAAALVRDLLTAQERLDETLRRNSKNWRLERMAQVDRNVLRLMLFEIERGVVGDAQAIEAAGELAKQYGTAESTSFVSGVLERCLEERRKKK